MWNFLKNGKIVSNTAKPKIGKLASSCNLHSYHMKNASVFSLSDALKFFMYIIIIKGISSI